MNHSRASTLRMIQMHYQMTRTWPRAGTVVGLCPDLPADRVAQRVDALIRRGLVEVTNDGRYKIVRANTTAPMEEM